MKNLVTKDCKSVIKRFRCGNRHRVAICFNEGNTQRNDSNFHINDSKSQNEDVQTHANLASISNDINLCHSNNILLQTARANVSSVN